MATFSIFLDFTTPSDKVNIIDLGKDIINGKYEMLISEYRAEKVFGDKDKADELKKKLPAFTPSGIFHSRRKSDNLEMYSDYIHLDYDKLEPSQLMAIKQAVTSCPFTTLAFTSPSGDGLKVFVEVNTQQEHHTLAYQQVKKYYDDLTGHIADEKCKDITRLCFVSHDPDAYRSITASKFKVDLPDSDLPVFADLPLPIAPAPAYNDAPATDLTLDFKFNQMIDFTNNKASYKEGSRNNYIYQLASNCNRSGIPQLDCEQLCIQHFDLKETEIRAAVKSAYDNHFAEHAKFANTAKTRKDFSTNNTTDDSEDYLKSTPSIPDHIFASLPDVLRSGCSVFHDARRRDVFLISALAILSGCLPGVYGVYHGERVYPHLFIFIIAPAASGKGVMKNAKRLADKYHERVLKASRDAQATFAQEADAYKMQCRNLKKTDPQPEKPVDPKFCLVFIPADSSASRMIEHLQNNGGHGIICETEADAMSGAKKQDWGDYSPVLRASFHHEKYAFSRKTNNEYIEIKEPKLAVCLSGTPAQVPRLIGSAEDGLFSRFGFYAFKSDLIWLDPSKSLSNIALNDHFDNLGTLVLNGIDFLSMEPTEFILTTAQWAKLNDTFSKYLIHVAMFNGDDASAIVYRLGLVCFRMAMILSALRKCDNAESKPILTCLDHDFDTALTISNTLLTHSVLMYNNLPNNSDKDTYTDDSKLKLKFFDDLPKDFTRQFALEKGRNLGFKDRTIDSMLRNALGTILEKVKSGHYSKI